MSGIEEQMRRCVRPRNLSSEWSFGTRLNLAGKPVLVKPQPAPIEERIRQLRMVGFGGYDAALLLMREHYPMREIVRHLHVSPRRIAELRKEEAKEKA